MRKNIPLRCAVSCILVLLVTGVLSAQPGVASQLQRVGLQSNEINWVQAQRGYQWCWAASISMVFQRNGLAISQEEIVRRTYGVDPLGHLPDWSASMQAINANLNGWGLDSQGNQYIVRSYFGGGAPTPARLIQELKNKRPVIIGYASSMMSGHAVVVTAVEYYDSPMGPVIQSIVVRDPYPTSENVANNGRVVYPGITLASRIQGYFYVSVEKANRIANPSGSDQRRDSLADGKVTIQNLENRSFYCQKRWRLSDGTFTQWKEDRIKARERAVFSMPDGVRLELRYSPDKHQDDPDQVTSRMRSDASETYNLEVHESEWSISTDD